MNYCVKIMVSEAQSKRIKDNAQVKGYPTVASYLRSLALEKDMFIEGKILENNKMLKEIKEKIDKIN